MAIYHLAIKNVSRGKGQSVIAMAAYRSGEKLVSERYNQTHWYRHRTVQPECWISAPTHAPHWATNRARLWNEVERVEKVKNARLAREIVIAIPNELNEQQQVQVVKQFVDNTFVAQGMVADVAIHRDDAHNPHAHILVTVRPFEADGTWGAKSKKQYVVDEQGEPIVLPSGQKKSVKVETTTWGTVETLKEWRSSWERTVNEALKQAGLSHEVSAKSFKDRGMDLKPTIHEGYQARQMEARGETSERCEHNRHVRTYNVQVTQLQLMKAEIEAENEGQHVSRHLSPEDKQTLRQLAKDLKLFIHADTLGQKKVMLQNWHNRLLVQRMTTDVPAEVFDSYEQVAQKIALIDSILTKEADRILAKYYPELAGKLTDFEKQQLTHETIHYGVIAPHLLPPFLAAVKDYELHTLIQQLNRGMGWLHSYRDVEQSMAQAQQKLAKYYGLTAPHLYDVEAFRRVYDVLTPEEQQRVTKLYTGYVAAKRSLRVIERVMEARIRIAFPSADVSTLSIHEKELLAQTIRYYGEHLTLEEVLDVTEGVPVYRFSEQAIQSAMEYVALAKVAVSPQERLRIEEAFHTLPPILQQFSREPAMRSFLINEAIAYGIIDEAQGEKLQCKPIDTQTSLRAVNAQQLLQTIFTPQSLSTLLGAVNAAEVERLQATRSQHLTHNRQKYAKIHHKEIYRRVTHRFS
ncbi:MAG: MobQ family relaxase [Caryophanon sp.]|nr:MobQ family relaxase [Caryophanon sp.]